MTLTKKTDDILGAVLARNRITADDAIILFENASLHQLGSAADHLRKQIHPDGKVTFVIDRNINYTNVCSNRCGFCAFYRNIDSPDAYLLDTSEVLKKVAEAVSSGGTQIMLQGGLHPDVTIEYYIQIFKAIKKEYDVVIHSLTPPEIIHIAKQSNLTVKETLSKLTSAGFDSLPGGGAEILSDSIRTKISPLKITAGEWLGVMNSAHQLGIYSTATMMFGIGEEIAERIEHLDRIRTLQDDTGKFRAFIPWTFQPGRTDIGGDEAPAEDYLKLLALSRIYLDNITNIQGSWLTQGAAIGQMSLFFGANDLGSTMLEENVVRSTGVHHKMNVEKIVTLIKQCGLTPAQRDTEYRVLKEF